MNERDFLKNFAKILNAEDTFVQIEERQARERKMLEQLSATLGVPIERQEDREVPQALLAQPKIIEQVANMLPEPEPVVENVIPPAPVLPVDIVTKSVEKISKASPKDIQKVVDSIPDSMRKELDIIKKSVTDLHSFASRQSQMGGGGEVWFRWLNDVDRTTIDTPESVEHVLRYNPTTKKFFFGELMGDHRGVTSIVFNPAGPSISPEPGMITWNAAEDCLNVVHEDGTVLQAGLEQHMQVYNGTNSTLSRGTVVRFSGVTGDTPIVVLHTADGTIPPLYTVGVITANIAAGAVGRATTYGKVRDVNTTGADVGETWVAGDIIYVSPTNVGKMTRVKPTAPHVVIAAAAVLRVGETDGELLVRPIIFPRLYYGSFSDTTNQVAVAANTAYAIKYNTTDIANGHRIDDTNKVVAENSGLYNYQFSMQLVSTNSSAKNVFIWARKNGVDIPNSASRITVVGNGVHDVAAWNFVVSMNANDYFQLMWAVDDTSLYIDAPAATAFCPAIPSVILTVTEAAL